MKSRLVKKSQMYERTHDHGFGNNVYLYSISGEFMGICKNEPDVIVAAVLKKPEINTYTYMLETYSVDKYKEYAKNIRSASEYYEARKMDIWWVKKNFKEVYVKENAKGKYHKYKIIKVYDKYNRLVFYEDKHTFIQLHIIPKGYRINLTHVPFSEYTHIQKYRKLTTTLTLVDVTPFDFPKYICDNNERKESTGYVMLPFTNRHQNCFMTTKVGEVIKKLEAKGFVFNKNELYKRAINMHESINTM